MKPIEENQIERGLVPLGSILPYRFSVIPAKFLLLDGSTYNVDDYPLLGALYGGSPGGTFDVDDYRDLPIWGAGSNAVGDVVGSDTVDLSHTHSTSGSTSTDGEHGHTTSGTTSTDGDHNHTTSGTTSTDGDHNHDTTVPSRNASLIGIGLGAVGQNGTFTSTTDGDHSHTTSGTTSTDGDHSHTTTGTAADNGDHSHTTSGTTDSQLGSTDKRPRRGHVNWIIRAL